MAVKTKLFLKVMALLTFFMGGYVAFAEGQPVKQLVRQWGVGGSGVGQIDDARGIFVSDGEVYIADTRNSRIQVFDLDGNYIRHWGLSSMPEDVKVYDGEVYVLLPLSSVLHVYTPTGTLVRYIFFDNYWPRRISIYDGNMYGLDYAGRGIEVRSVNGSYVTNFTWYSYDFPFVGYDISVKSGDIIVSGYGTYFGSPRQLLCLDLNGAYQFSTAIPMPPLASGITIASVVSSAFGKSLFFAADRFTHLAIAVPAGTYLPDYITATGIRYWMSYTGTPMHRPSALHAYPDNTTDVYELNAIANKVRVYGEVPATTSLYSGADDLLIKDGGYGKLVSLRYPDGMGVSIKAPCRVATTANITLSGEQTIDVIEAEAGDRVLVKDQTTPSQNGIYDVAEGPWSRSSDFDSNAEVAQYSIAYALEGSAGALKPFVQTTPNPILGTSPLDLIDLGWPMAAIGSTIGGMPSVWNSRGFLECLFLKPYPNKVAYAMSQDRGRTWTVQDLSTLVNQYSSLSAVLDRHRIIAVGWSYGAPYGMYQLVCYSMVGTIQPNGNYKWTYTSPGPPPVEVTTERQITGLTSPNGVCKLSLNDRDGSLDLLYQDRSGGWHIARCAAVAADGTGTWA